MNEKAALSALIGDYCAELKAVDASAYEGYVFSKSYQKRKRQAVSLSKGRRGGVLARTTLFMIAAAVLLVGCGIAYAYEPIRSFFVESSDEGIKLTPDSDTMENKGPREQMQEEYVIDPPEGFALVSEETVHGYTHFGHTYKNENGRSFYFDQYNNDGVVEYYPPESEVIKRTDKNGNEVIAVYLRDTSSPDIRYVSLYRNTGEYTLALGGDLSEDELMEIYYTARVKE